MEYFIGLLIGIVMGFYWGYIFRGHNEIKIINNALATNSVTGDGK